MTTDHHVALVPFTGLRVRQTEMLAFGMTLPGLSERAAALSELPALGLLTLAGMLPEGWTCSYHASANVQDLESEVLRQQPTIVAVSALTASVLEAYAFCTRMKQHGIPTVIGGLHATAMPEEAAQFASAVCVKDGESSWHQILQDAADGSLQTTYQPRRPFSLNESPVPRFDLLGHRKTPRWTLQTQRGCPWSCEFCAASRLLGPARFKPTDRIGKELDAIARLDSTPWVELADDNTFAGRDDSEQLLEQISKANISYFTESDWQIAERPELIDRLAASGCVQLLMGIESLAFQYPGMGSKRCELDRMIDRVEMIQDAGIVVNGCFILGAPGETNESLDRMIEFIANSPLAEVQLTIQTPFPGTALHRRMDRDGRLLADRDWSHYTLFDVVYEPDGMTVDELEQGFRRAMTEVFSVSLSKQRSKRRRQIWSKHLRRRSHQ